MARKAIKAIALTHRDRGVLTTVNALREELRVATTPQKTLDVAAKAAREKRIFEAIGASVERCNEWAEIYLCAYWKFGDLVKDIPSHRPRKGPIDPTFLGSKGQREYARSLRAAVADSDIPEYVKAATDRLEAASIAGCLEWIAPGAHVGHNTGETEWFTPAEYVEAARAVLGAIDLDPASTSEANAVIQAKRFYTAADDGLTKVWRGRVWMNPPYANTLISKFCTKLADSVRAGTVPAAVVLVNNATETAWFRALTDVSAAICFPSGRIQFWYPARATVTPLQGQAVLYIGERIDVFADAFAAIGFLALIRR